MCAPLYMVYINIYQFYCSHGDLKSLFYSSQSIFVVVCSLSLMSPVPISFPLRR